MSAQHNLPDTAELRADEVWGTPPGDTTATDLRLPLPEYMKEIRNILERAEAGYLAGDWGRVAEAATEGLALLRIQGQGPPPPPQYREFFRCFLLLPQYRQALALFKEASLRVRRGGKSEAAELLRRAWDLLAVGVEGMRQDLPTQTLVYEYPVAGRLLRGLTSLRHRLQAADDK